MSADSAHRLLLHLRPLIRAWEALRTAYEHHEAQEEPELRARTLPAVAAAEWQVEEQLADLTPGRARHADKAA